MNARLFGLGRELAGAGGVTVAQGDQGRQRQALRCRRFAEELRHPAFAEQLAARGLAAQQLAELGDDDGRRRIEVGAGVEDNVDTIDIAREQQQLGQKDAAADVGRRLADRRIGRTQRLGQAALAEKLAGVAGGGRL